MKRFLNAGTTHAIFGTFAKGQMNPLRYQKMLRNISEERGFIFGWR